jgi:hypothetical protein
MERVADLFVELFYFCQALLLNMSDLKWFKIGIVAITRINTFIFSALLAISRARICRASIAHNLLIFNWNLKYK